MYHIFEIIIFSKYTIKNISYFIKYNILYTICSMLYIFN